MTTGKVSVIGKATPPRFPMPQAELSLTEIQSISKTVDRYDSLVRWSKQLPQTEERKGQTAAFELKLRRAREIESNRLSQRKIQ